MLAIVGWFRGVVAQAAALFGFLGAVWAAAMVHRWVGAHWSSAQPTTIFWALGWLVTLIFALAVVSLVNVLGDRIGRFIQEGPVGWLDRMLGIPAGAAMGVILATLLLLVAARLPMGNFVERSITVARAPRPLLAGGAEVCRMGHNFPGAHGLRREFESAHHRLEHETPSI